MSLFEVKKTGYLAFLGIPIGVAVAEYMRSQTPTAHYPLNPDAETRVKKIAENMGIIPEIIPIFRNKKTFERVKASGFNDHKTLNISYMGIL